MGFPEIPSSPQAEEWELPWSKRVPQCIGLLAISVGVLMADQRHEFTHPNWSLALIILVIAPWTIDMFDRSRDFFLARRFSFLPLIAWTVVVLGGVSLLTLLYKGPDDYAPFIVTILIGEMASTAGPRFGAGVFAASTALLLLFVNLDHPTGMFIWLFAFVIGWMGGTAYRAQVEIAFELAQAQTKLSEQAAEEERHRLARDVHDLIAHSLAVTMLQLSGARLALNAGDTQEALAALQDAENAGRSAMSEIHRTVGLLGATGNASADVPTPNAADLPDLVRSFKEAGLQIDFELEGDLSIVPLGSGLASYRVVQESLSNAVKHAPGATVQLRIHIDREAIEIHVVNDVLAGVAAGPGSGHGLVGMSERVTLLGGSVSSGNGDGTWKVNATIPWENAPS